MSVRFRGFAMIAGALSVMVGGSGCAEFSCTDILMYAVLVQVRDGAGEPVVPDELVYTWEGETTVVCAGDCDRTDFALGPEAAGSYEITARSGELEAFASTFVNADRCHVITEEVTLVLAAP